jgi:Nucleotidyl transferase of unknown function (DUF2204)
MTAFASNIGSRSIHDVYAEGLRYFMGEGMLQGTLAQLSSDLKQRGIDYMVIGAVALMAYGYPRFTEDIDLVLTKEGLETFHRELIGLGYVPAFQGAKKRLRSARDGVPIEIDGVRVVTLEKLIELKLASGMTALDRLKDLADVQELIKVRGLTSEFADSLNPYVRGKFLELCRAVEQTRREL